MIELLGQSKPKLAQGRNLTDLMCVALSCFIQNLGEVELQ